MTHQRYTLSQDGPPSEVEELKLKSRFLRGDLEETLKDPLTGSIPELDNRLMKFHGSYMQDNRDLRQEREKQKLEPAYQFMVRIRAAGGVVSAKQWLEVDRIAQKYAGSTIRLTTRQSFQLHGILKWNMKKAYQEINQALLSTLAACGDVNRNVMCNPNPYQSEAHAEVYEWAKKLSTHLEPRTNAYHEIFLDGEKVLDSRDGEEVNEEPIYGPVYLPRKFKIGITVPPTNDVDVFSQDLGLIAIYEQDELKGFNIAVGGGMGMSYGDEQTYPQIGRVIGFCRPDQVVDLAEKVVTVQRDYGNRSVRKYARLKYTIDRRGVEWFVNELQERLGYTLEEARPYQFDLNGDRYGWVKGVNGKWHLTLFIENGRIIDWDDYPLMSGLREIAKIHTGDFRLTPNQNLVIGNVSSQKKKKIEELVARYKLSDGHRDSALRRNAMACVSLPTCGMAMAEAERYMPEMLTKLEGILTEAGLGEQEIVIRMTGCPNGCARPFLGEIAFTGKAVGRYNLYMGASFTGDRLNKLYRENINEQEILDTLKPIIQHYAREREPGEHFGDFVVRTGYVAAVDDGMKFHA